MATYELQYILKEYKAELKAKQATEAKIKTIANLIPGINKILKIKGIGIITAAGFIAEVGDLTRFSHPKQIIKLAGLNLRENSSGEHKGQTTISKRGRKRLRALLFRAMLPLIAKNEEFKQLHKYYTTRAVNPLKKMQSITALCGKLIRILYAIITKDIEYDPNLASPSRELDQNAQHDKITLEGGIFLWQRGRILLRKKSSLSYPKLRVHVPLK